MNQEPGDKKTIQFVRPLQARDVEPVKDLIAATGLFPPELFGPMVAPFFSQAEPIEHWVVFDRGGPVGVAYWVPERMTSGTWNLLLVAVHPAFQRQGIGAALVDHVEQQLRDSGERILLVETSGLDVFRAAQDFYSKCGFTSEARVRDFYNAGEDKLIFRKALLVK